MLSLVPSEGAPVEEIAGQTVVRDFGDPAAEYAAVRQSAILVDRSHRHRLVISGAKAAATLAGLVTNDVAALAPGQGQYAAALTPKGKIVADLRIFALDGGEFLIDAPPRAAEGWMGIVRKYINPRFAKWEERSGSMATIGVFGVSAARIVAAVTDIPAAALAALEPYAHVNATVNGAHVMVARTPDAGVEGFELFAPAEGCADLWRSLASTGARPAGMSAWDIVRIEAGRPEWGIDIDDSTLAQEANLEELHAISFTKGCYTGQETVARVHFRGHVNRHLRGIRFVSGSLPQTGAELVDESAKVVGELRSVALSPRLGGIALAMVRREVEPGASVSIRWADGECQGGVLLLPFPL
jgi:tRNA-modifying protein YgfZ